MASNKQNNKYDDNKKKSTGKKRNKEEIARDKFEVDLSSSGKKKVSKTPKPKNPFKRLAIALFPQKNDTKGEKGRKILLLVAIAILIGTLAYLLSQLINLAYNSAKNKALADSAGNPMDNSGAYNEPDRLANPDWNIRTTAGDEDPEYIDLTPVVNTPLNTNFDYLRGINPDTRAWVKITGTQLNNVVLQRKNESNDSNYYLTHDFYGNESKSGEIFSTWRNNWDGTDDNIILFGHNMASGDCFAYVMHYVPNDASREPLAFYKVHPTILFQQDGGQSETYKVFAGMLVNTQKEYGEVFDYTTKTQFNSADEFNRYILDVMDRSWFYTDVDIQYGDKLLTLSTCYWPLGRSIETRWVILARKVRPGESEYVDTSVAERNWGAKLFDYYYQIINTQWYGSNWDTSKLLSY
ncbi:MAG: class B sortase [Oscillospiraceae bacterium]|nr:class B sortase [Oscillospiraceae bacterium]